MNMLKKIIKAGYLFLCNFSPYTEIMMRKFYWKNVKVAKHYTLPNSSKKNGTGAINIDEIFDYLREENIGEGNLLIVHSSYGALKNTNLSPEEINQKLIDFVGKDGTIAMPAIRKYEEEGDVSEYLLKNMENIVCTYNVKQSRVITGALPSALMRRNDSCISRFPLNSMVAVGKYASEMMKHNLEGEFLSPNGLNSSWKYCYDKKAIIIGLGVDQVHSLTVLHVAEEAFGNWPINKWFRQRPFNIIDEEFETQIVVYERAPKWGAMYFAENKLKRDLIEKGILRIKVIDDVEVSIIYSEKLITFLQNNNQKGYPYYVSKKDLI